MRRWSHRLLPACLLAAGAVASPALARAQPRPDDRAEAALARLFRQTCLRHAGDPAGLRAGLAGPAYRHVADTASPQLLARPGQAWRVVDAPGHLMVLSFDDGWCGNGATAIDPHGLTMQIFSTMRSAGVTMRLMGAGPDGREQRYLLLPPPPARPVVLLVLLQPLVRDGADGPMQANLFAAPLPPPPEPPR